MKHLDTEHDVAQNETRRFISSNRIGRQAQTRYWCGFCRKINTIQSEGKSRLNERFDHIDFGHFKKGQRIDDWLPESGHLTKKQLREDAERLKLMEANQPTVHDSNEDTCPVSDDVPNDGIGSLGQTSRLGDTSVEAPVELSDTNRKSTLPAPLRQPGGKQRKRKIASSYSAADTSPQNHATNTGKKKRGRPPLRSRAAASDQAATEQCPMSPSAISLSADDPQPQFQDFVVCVGPLLHWEIQLTGCKTVPVYPRTAFSRE